MKLSEKLAKRIAHEFNINAPIEIRSTHAGYWQQSTGAWSWYAEAPGHKDIGSQYPMKECLNAQFWYSTETPGGIEINPINVEH